MALRLNIEELLSDNHWRAWRPGNEATALIEWNALQAPGGGFCHNEYKTDLAVATFHQSGAC